MTGPEPPWLSLLGELQVVAEKLQSPKTGVNRLNTLAAALTDIVGAELNR